MKLKKVLCLSLALTMVLGLAACGGGGGGKNDASTSNPASTSGSVDASGTPGSGGSTDGEYWLKDPNEVTGTLVIYTTMDDGQQQVVEDVWYNHYPNCEIEWLNDSLGTLMTKVKTEASNPYADIVLGGLFQSDDDSYYEDLEPYTAVNAAEQTVSDPNGYYTYLDMQYMCLIVNEELETAAGVTINGYQDLLNPALQGKVILADPASTSSGFRQLQSILALCGNEFNDDASWEYIQKLMANSISTTSSSTVYKTVMNGEYVVGLSYESIVQYQIENGASNIRLVYPAEGNTACASGGAMVKNCPNRVAAEALLDLLGTEEMQQARAESNCARGTNVNFTYAGYPADSEIGVIDLDFPYIGEHKAEILEKWAEYWEDYGLQ